MLERIIVCNHAHAAQASFAVAQRGTHTVQHVLARERIKLENAAAADNGGRHGNHRIFGRRTDEANRPLFNRRQNGVALRLVPAVTLVEQQIGRLAGRAAAILGFFQYLAHVGHAACHGVHFYKRAVRGFGDHRRKRRLSAAGRPVKNAACQPVRLNGTAQQPSLADNMLLADEFIERACAHAIGKRRGRVRLFLHRHSKQILHGCSLLFHVKHFGSFTWLFHVKHQ